MGRLSNSKNIVPYEEPKTFALTGLYVFDRSRVRFAEIKELDLALVRARDSNSFNFYAPLHLRTLHKMFKMDSLKGIWALL